MSLNKFILLLKEKYFFMMAKIRNFVQKNLKLNKNLPRCRVCGKFPAVTFPRKFSRKSFNYLPFRAKNGVKNLQQFSVLQIFRKIGSPHTDETVIFFCLNLKQK
jgi:hypothetical protein